MSVLVVLADFNIVEHCQRVRGEDRQRAIQGDQVTRYRLVVNAHEPHRQSWALLAWQTRLEQANHALALVAHAQQQDLALAIGHRDLVAGDQRDTAPGNELRTKQADSGRGHATPGGFAAKGGNGQGVGQEERWLFPDLGQQLVEIIGCRCTGKRKDALIVGHLRQQAVVGVVDEFAFLVFLDGLDGQAQLFLDLVMRAAVQVRNAGMHIQNRADRVEEKLTRLLVAIDKCERQLVLGLACGAGDLDRLRVFDGVEAKDASFHRHPLQQVGQPARRNGGQLRSGFGGVGQLARSVVAKRGVGNVFGQEGLRDGLKIIA